MRSRSPKSNHFLPMSQWCFCASLGQNPPIGSGNGVQTRLIFTVFIVQWPWKLDQDHQNIINSFNYPNDTIHKAWPGSIIWFRRMGADNLFCQNYLTFKVLLWPWKWGQGHQNLIISSPCLSGVSVQVMSKSTCWFRRYSADKAHFYSLYSVVTLKIKSRSRISNPFNYPNDTIYKVWPELIICFKR